MNVEQDATGPQAPDLGEKSLPVIWVAMLSSVPVYAVLAYFVGGHAAVTIDRTLEQWILVFLAMTAGLHVLVVLLLRQMLAAITGRRYRIYCILRWALMEGVGVYGLILSFLGVGFGVTSIFFAVSLLLIGAARPGPTDRAVYEAQFR